MYKYHTLDSPNHEGHLYDNIQQRWKLNEKVKATLDSQTFEQKPMSQNKSIIFVRLPKQHKNHFNSFRSSMYESSLKRLKQQKITLVKQTAIPKINSKKTPATFEEETIRRSLKDSVTKKRDNIPYLQVDQKRKHFSYFQRSREISEEERDDEAAIHVIRSSIPRRKSTFEVDSSVLGYHNLKEKYLELRQLSLTNEKKSQLLDKAQYRRYNPERYLQQQENQGRMEKIILEHMNRYKKRDLFQTKVNGFKTTIYPHDKSNPHDQQNKERRRALQTNRHHQHVQNFVRKKKRNYHPSTTLNQYSQFDLANGKRKNSYSKQTDHNPKTNPSNLQKLIQCTPWETDGDF